MTKKRSFLGLYLILALVIIVCAVVLSLTVGINLGSDIGGGSQIEVLIDDQSLVKEQIGKIKETVKENGYEVESIFTEDKGTESYIVVRIADKDVNPELSEKIQTKLAVNKENVSSVLVINGTVTKNTVMWAAVAIICVLLAIFIGGWIRYKLIGGFTLIFASLISLLISVALLVITRVRINFTSLIIIITSGALVLFASIYALERVRENSKYKHNENAEPRELVMSSVNSTLKPLIVFLALIFILSLVCVCVPISEIALTGSTILICLASVVFCYYFIAMEFYANLFELKVERDKQRLSRNPVQVKKQEKPSNEDKKLAKEKAKKDKEFKKKFKSKDKDSSPVV